MKLADFDFHLPEDRIALRPANPKEWARLFVIEPPENRHHKMIADLIDLLKAGDVMVLNDTRVISAQLKGLRAARALDSNNKPVQIHINLIQKNENYPDREIWYAFAQPGRRLRPKDVIHFEHDVDGLKAEILSKQDNGTFELRLYGHTNDIITTLSRVGTMPLPPIFDQSAKQMLKTKLTIKPTLPNETVLWQPQQQVST